jgi:hypothetical protein
MACSRVIWHIGSETRESAGAQCVTKRTLAALAFLQLEGI